MGFHLVFIHLFPTIIITDLLQDIIFVAVFIVKREWIDKDISRNIFSNM